MILSEETVALFTDWLTNPAAHNSKLPALADCFITSETGTPKHILYTEYLKYIDRVPEHLPKVFFYIIMDNLYSQIKCQSGELGYPLIIKETEPDKEPQETSYE